MLGFGGYNGASFVINQTYLALPQLVLGQILPHSAVGLYNRAQMVSDIPDRVVLTGVFSVAFPALAAEIREGRGLKEPYLRALGLITAVYWPALILLALLAHPVVSFILGRQWVEVVPLLQVMAIAALAWFPVMLTSPVLLAVGANRDRVMADLIGRSVSALMLCSAAWFGIMAMAASKLVTLPFQMVLSLRFVRRHVAFSGRELSAALWKSAVVTTSSAAGPIWVAALSGWSLRSFHHGDCGRAALGGDRLDGRRARDATPRAARAAGASANISRRHRSCDACASVPDAPAARAGSKLAASGVAGRR